MRVTEGANFETIRNTIGKAREKMDRLQTKSATLKKLNEPSDDPVGTVKVLELRTDRMNHDQFSQNMDLAKTFLNMTDHGLKSLADVLVRAKELALSQSSYANSSQGTRLAVAEELAQLMKQALTVANTRVGDRYIFSGYKTDRPAVDHEGHYQGDRGEIQVEVGNDVYIPINIPGSDVFHVQAAKSTYGWQPESPEYFAELKHLQAGLLTGDLESIRGTLESFDGLHAKIIALRAKIGARVSSLDSSASANERHTITQATLSSSLEDADMAQVMTELSKEETIFRSALASAKRLVQPTLLDFLR